MGSLVYMYRQRLQAVAKTFMLTSYATQTDLIDHIKGLHLYQQQSRVHYDLGSTNGHHA